MAKWIQLNLFTGEPMPPRDEKTEKQRKISKQIQLALAVQLLIARLDPLQDTMKLISELCQTITGVSYPINLDERRRSKLQRQQQQTGRNVAAKIQKAKRKRGRPKGSRNPKPIDHTLRKQIDAAYSKREPLQ